MKRIVLALPLVLLGSCRNPVARDNGPHVLVSAQANVFAAGRASVPDLRGGGGALPPSISVVGGQMVTFPDITGRIRHVGAGIFNGPEGRTDGGPTDINSYRGIAGILHANRTMFLVGVFVAGAEPDDPAPERLDATDSQDLPAVAPALAQVFFIGDGRDRSGNIQRFTAPAGATQLHLGFADAFFFRGDPGSYADNTGELRVDFRNSQ